MIIVDVETSGVDPQKNSLLSVGIPEEPKPHNGLMGAKVEAEALSRLFYGRSLLPEFKKYPIPEIS